MPAVGNPVQAPPVRAVSAVVAGQRRRLLTLPPGLSAAVEAFDAGVDRNFEHLRGRPLADRLFYGASAVGDHSLLWLILASLRGLRSDHDFRAALRTAAALGVESALVNVGIKSLFRRARPVVETNRPLPLRRPRSSSFPSGHATSAFCAATLLADDDPLGPLYYGVATVVAASRVHVRIHHASDVVAGVVFGLLLGRFIRRVHPLPARPHA